jgi:hypothetical protein
VLLDGVDVDDLSFDLDGASEALDGEVDLLLLAGFTSVVLAGLVSVLFDEGLAGA